MFVGLAAAAIGSVAIATDPLADRPKVGEYGATLVVGWTLLVVGVISLLYGVICSSSPSCCAPHRRQAHNTRNLLRLALGFVGIVATFAVPTENWLGLLLSLGVIGLAITFALQQPLLSLIAWVYITVKQPYGVGGRVRIDDVNGDVIEVDFPVTTLREINGELVSSNQPSGRVVIVPNSVVRFLNVVNFGGGGSRTSGTKSRYRSPTRRIFEFARAIMCEEATDLLGEEMSAGIAAYREALSETPVELEVYGRPTVNVTQGESWVELRLRYLTHPRQGQRVKNALYERILDRFNDHPDRVALLVGRSR